MSSLSSIIHSVSVASGTETMNMNSLTVRTVAKRRVRQCSISMLISHFLCVCMNVGCLHSLYDSRKIRAMFAASVTSQTAVSFINDKTRSNICYKPIRAKHGSRDIAGNNLLFTDFVMAAVRGKTFRAGLSPVISSPVNEEDNSDFDSSCSTLSEVEIENSPPQSQVPLKRTASVMAQREDSTGKFPPKQLCFLAHSVTKG